MTKLALRSGCRAISTRIGNVSLFHVFAHRQSGLAVGLSFTIVDDFLDAVRKMPIYSHHGTVDILDYALRLLQKSPSIRSVLNKLHKIDLQDLPNIPSLADWNPQEIATFNKNIETYDDELSEFKRSLGKKSIPQIVHFYYREKG